MLNAPYFKEIFLLFQLKIFPQHQTSTTLLRLVWENRATLVFPCPLVRFPPGFAFFGLNRVRFSLFRCFVAAKFLVLFLCRLPFAGYKLKSLVIPPNRDVSFLT